MIVMTAKGMTNGPDWDVEMREDILRSAKRMNQLIEDFSTSRSLKPDGSASSSRLRVAEAHPGDLPAVADAGRAHAPDRIRRASIHAFLNQP